MAVIKLVEVVRKANSDIWEEKNDKYMDDDMNEDHVISKAIRKLKDEDFHIVEIEFWKKQELLFVETPAVIKILQCLESEHTVLIVGEPGIGKSMLMHHVALKIHSTTSYCIVPCSGIQDIFHHFNMDKEQMFVLDDICGRFTPSLSDIECLIKNEHKLKQILERGKTKIAATCRLDIYFEETVCKSCTVFQPNIFNLSQEYSKEDKLKICMMYLSKTSCAMLKNQDVEFTPLMCYLYSKNTEFNLTDFLHCPYGTYQKEWEKFKVMNPHKYCSLFLCVIHNGIIKESLFDIFNESSNKTKYFLKNIYEICGVNRGTSRIKMKSTFDSIIGTYLEKTKTEYRVLHDKMFDFLCCYFGSKDTLVRCILRYSDIRVLNERTQLESINAKCDKYTILISKRYEQEYFERIKKDLQLGKINQCFCNSQMKHEKHRSKFLKVLQTIDDKFLFEQMFSRKCLQFTFKHKEYADAESHIEYNDNGDLSEPLITSCFRGYHDIVQFFITKYVDLKNYYSFKTPLTAACYGGHEKIVLLLLDKGCDINQIDDASQTPLTAACSGGHDKIVQLLIEKGCDPSYEGRMGRTPLTAACENGDEEIVQLLIRRGCDVNQGDDAKQTPLTAACSSGHANIVQLLIEKGCDLSYDDRVANTPLTAACINGHEKIAQLLISRGCDVNQADVTTETPLTVACGNGHANIIQLLIDKGCDTSQNACIGETPLTAACRNGNEKIVQLLIRRGCDVNQVDATRDTPLTAACGGGNEKIVQLLIDKGCGVTQADGTTNPLMAAACLGGNEKIVKILIENGCDINEQGSCITDTPLLTVCWRGDVKLAQLLLEKGCDINRFNGNGDTPLSAACYGGDEKMVQFLIDKGCDVIRANVEIHLFAACRGGNEKIVQLLLKHGFDINPRNYFGDAPLVAASWAVSEKLVELLMDNGYDINQFDVNGDTPLAAACIMGNERFVQFLIDKGCDVTQAECRKKIHLVAACRGGNMQIVQLLLEKGCDVNRVDVMGQTPLTAACSNRKEKLVQFLINAGCDINQVDGLGGTPLEAACKSRGGNKNIVQFLLDEGCDVEEKHLIAAHNGENDKIVQLIKEKKCDLKHADGMAKTPLTAACQ
ncbi:ankyrin repeat domain-containing protein 50-like [Mytilus edulis]|uniref:ankyrin repeat domain-containing protein 50-like n=1 Tax=Mytilus edulis TaxID=6550 RepID=UPI0039F006B2